jgi:hypothetical protein
VRPGRARQLQSPTISRFGDNGAQLWAAAGAGKTAEVIRLVAARARIDSHNPGDVSLLARPRLLRFILTCTIYCDCDPTQSYDTALHNAAWKGHTSTIGVLARLGADLNAKNKVRASHIAHSTVCSVGPRLRVPPNTLCV